MHEELPQKSKNYGERFFLFRQKDRKATNKVLKWLCSNPAVIIRSSRREHRQYWYCRLYLGTRIDSPFHGSMDPNVAKKLH
jgi:hypothetical protein